MSALWCISGTSSLLREAFAHVLKTKLRSSAFVGVRVEYVGNTIIYAIRNYVHLMSVSIATLPAFKKYFSK